jgi:hypothetical protein
VDLVGARTDGVKLSLKLYHARELQLGYQQSMTEAPHGGKISCWLWRNGRSKGFFRRGVRPVFPQLDSQALQAVDEFLDFLYSAARCSLCHSAIIRQGIAIGPCRAAVEFDPVPL